MSAAKTERLMNLLIMLLVQRRFVARDRIRTILYPEASDEAFERMFERDKEELRSLGVPVEVGQLDGYFDDEPGYRIRPDAFALPEVDLAADEAAVVGLASRVWQQQRMAKATTDAVRKLTAAGIDIDVTALDIAQPSLSADEPAFDAVLDALLERQEVEFAYSRSGQDEPALRRVRPWGVTRASGRWYLVGWDVDRDAERVFRLSRVHGEARAVGRSGAYEIPADLDLAAAARRLAPAPSTERAVLLVRPGSALPLRRAAEPAHTETGVAGPDGTTAWDRLVITRAPAGLEDEICGLTPNVVVEEPAELRSRVIARLRAVVAGGGA